MKLIFFKFSGGQPQNFFNTPHGWLALGDHFNHEDGTALLSIECRTMDELRAQADYLKRLIDESVIDAEKNLPSAK